jgi:hypothetical protein
MKSLIDINPHIKNWKIKIRIIQYDRKSLGNITPREKRI